MRLAAYTLVAVGLGFLGAAQAGDKPTFEALLADLSSPVAKTRLQAAEALGKQRRREAVQPLTGLARDEEPKVRLAMVRALAELRDVGAVPTLVTALDDGDRKVREEAISALVELYAEKERTTPVDRFLQIFSDEYDRSSVGPYVQVDPSVVPGLVSRLRGDQDGSNRESAALALGILDGRPAVRDLVAALEDPAQNVRAAAAIALGKVGSAEDGKALIARLEDVPAVRNRALYALGVLRVKEAGPALRQMYETNRRQELGLKALACLSRIGDPGQAELFRQLAYDPDVEKRRLAVEGLGRIADASMLPAFKKDFQRERNDELRLAYAFAISLLGDRAFIDTLVLCLPSRTLASRCRGYLGEMVPAALPELYEYLGDQSADIRGQLVEIISEAGDAAAIPHLEPLVSDTNRGVADRANRAVERLKRATRSPAPKGAEH